MSQVSKKWTTEQMEKAENDVEAMRAVIRQLRHALDTVRWKGQTESKWSVCKVCGKECAVNQEQCDGDCVAMLAMKASESYVEGAEPKLLRDVVTVTPGGRGCGSWLSVGTTSVAMRSEDADDLKRDIGRAIAEAVNDAIGGKDAKAEPAVAKIWCGIRKFDREGTYRPVVYGCAHYHASRRDAIRCPEWRANEPRLKDALRTTDA